MKTLSFLFGAASVMAMMTISGCALVPTSVTLPAGQALLVAEAGADGVNHAAIIAAPLLHGAAALRVKACVDGANNGVSAAHGLYAKGDVGGTVSSLKTALADIADCTAQTKAATGDTP